MTETEIKTMLKNQKIIIGGMLETLARAGQDEEDRANFGFVPSPKRAPELMDEPDSDNHERVGHPDEEP